MIYKTAELTGSEQSTTKSKEVEEPVKGWVYVGVTTSPALGSSISMSVGSVVGTFSSAFPGSILCRFISGAERSGSAWV